MNTVAERFVELWDAIWVYYSAFLTVQERKKYTSKVKAVLDRLKVPEEKRPQLWNILDQQRKQAKTDANNDRKAKILSALFLNQEKTILLLNLYRGITEKFLYFTKKKTKLQSHRCMIYTLIFLDSPRSFSLDSLPQMSSQYMMSTN